MLSNAQMFFPPFQYLLMLQSSSNAEYNIKRPAPQSPPPEHYHFSREVCSDPLDSRHHVRARSPSSPSISTALDTNRKSTPNVSLITSASPKRTSRLSTADIRGRINRSQTITIPRLARQDRVSSDAVRAKSTAKITRISHRPETRPILANLWVGGLDTKPSELVTKSVVKNHHSPIILSSTSGSTGDAVKCDLNDLSRTKGLAAIVTRSEAGSGALDESTVLGCENVSGAYKCCGANDTVGPATIVVKSAKTVFLCFACLLKTAFCQEKWMDTHIRPTFLQG